MDIKPNLMDVAKSPYFDGLADDQKVKFQEFFDHAMTTSAAWEVYDDDNKKYYSVQGQAVQELLFNYDLDVSLVLYYTYKRILAARKKPRKYIKFCITPPWAS
ncbi:hypothetical protein MKW94_030198, partial [Papaver nudicaule]|nr:hypothetical protein [Papaver nudicaule]